MAKIKKEYLRLPGSGSRLDGGKLVAFSRAICTLWVGGDHLLLVDRTGFTETYKRFYYCDIQGFIVRKTSKAAIGSCVLGILTLLFSLWALAVANLPGRITLWIIAGFFAFFTLVNLALGPSCVAQIKTPVQTEQLPCWRRLNTARRCMDRIRPLLQEAQGAFSPDELKAELETRLRTKSELPPAGTP